MVLGYRVVRGPGGNHGDTDAGHHHVGTITAAREDNSVEVVWDTGQVTLHGTGPDVKEELRVFDSGPRGIRHKHLRCEECDVTEIVGTRWRCSVCDNVSLCTPCYHDDCHDKTHPFIRIDFPGSDGVKVEKRSTSQRDRVFGLYPDAGVSRGPHWTYDDQDGGAGSFGVIADVVDASGQSQRGMVTVAWRGSDVTYAYRAGHQGKVDVICHKAAPGADCYYEHLANVDLQRCMKWHSDCEVLKAGDRVYIDVPLSDIRQWLQNKGTWTGNMEELGGAMGVINTIQSDCVPEVDFKFTTVAIDGRFVEKVPNHAVGDTVRVIQCEDKLQVLQQNHGGWEEEEKQAIGRCGVVKVIDSDGDVAVSFGRTNLVFHPASLVPCPEEKLMDRQQQPHPSGDERQVPTEEKPRDTESSHANINSGGQTDEAPPFLQSFGGLAFLQAMAQGQAIHKHMFVKAVFENKEAEVRSLLAQNPELACLCVNDIPVLSFAAHQGNTSIVRILLDAGTDVNVYDPNMHTPLHVALQERKCDAARLLLERGANCRTVDSDKRSPLHTAALLNLYSLIKLILDKGGDPNLQDKDKNTPLHFAIYNQHDQAADILIQRPDINIWLKNDKCFNALAFACLRHHTLGVEKLIAKEPLLVNSPFSKSMDGFSPLHIAAVNDHVAEAKLLLEKGQANVNALNDNRFTPLHLAANEGFINMTTLLVNSGANCQLKDVLGNTPLHACLVGRRGLPFLAQANPQEDEERIKVAILLIQHNARLEEPNALGLRPLQTCLIPRIKDAVTSYAQTRGFQTV